MTRPQTKCQLERIPTMIIRNIVLFVITFIGSYFFSKFIDRRYGIKEKLYAKFKDSTWGAWLILFSYVSVLTLVVSTGINLRNDNFISKITYVFIIIMIAYFSDYHNYKK